MVDSAGDWKAEICAGLDVIVARALAERGMLRRQGDNLLQCTVNIGEGSVARLCADGAPFSTGAAMRPELLAELRAVMRGDPCRNRL